MTQVDMKIEEVMLTVMNNALSLLSDYSLEIVRRTSKVWHINYRPCEPLNRDLPIASSWVVASLEFQGDKIEIKGHGSRKVDVDDTEALADYTRTCVEAGLFKLYNGNLDGPDTADL